MNNYKPLNITKSSIILDTDIGPDCDDAGAVDILFKLSSKYDLNILGIANCTSNIYGNGVIRAIADYHKRSNLKVGQNKTIKMAEDGLKYNKAVTQKYFGDSNDSCEAEDASEFYYNLLSSSDNNSVTVITIGMLTNIGMFLKKHEQLFNQKVNTIISMGGSFTKEMDEYNIACDIENAKTVLEKYKGNIIFSGYEVGSTILTGFDSPINSPVFDCYYNYLDKKIPCLRSSWDLTTVHFAIIGESGMYKLSEPIDIDVTDTGSFIIKSVQKGNRYYILKTATDNEIEIELNSLLRS